MTDRAAIVHTAEQMAAIFGDFLPELAPTIRKHVEALEQNGFSREEAVRLAANFQATVVRTLMRAALEPKDPAET